MSLPYDLRVYVIPEYQLLEDLADSPMFIREFAKRVPSQETIDYVLKSNDSKALRLLYLRLSPDERITITKKLAQIDNIPMVAEAFTKYPEIVPKVRYDILPSYPSSKDKERAREYIRVDPKVFIPIFYPEIEIGTITSGTQDEKFRQDLEILTLAGEAEISEDLKDKLKSRYGPMLNYPLMQAFQRCGYPNIGVNNSLFQVVHAILYRILKNQPEILLLDEGTVNELLSQYVDVSYQQQYRKFIVCMFSDLEIRSLLEEMAVALL